MEMKDFLKQHTDAVETQINALNADVKRAVEQAGIAQAISIDLEQKATNAWHYAGRGDLEAKS